MKRFAKVPFLVGVPVLAAVVSLVVGIPSRSQAAGQQPPLLVSETDSPGHTPVHGVFSSDPDFAYEVPADKRLVIEYAAGGCVVTSGTGTVVDGSISTVLREASWDFALPSLRVSSPTSIRFMGPVHIYADPGTKVSAGGLTTGTALAGCGGYFAGYLTKPE